MGIRRAREREDTWDVCVEMGRWEVYRCGCDSAVQHV